MHQDDNFTVYFLISKSTGNLGLSESNVQRVWRKYSIYCSTRCWTEWSAVVV